MFRIETRNLDKRISQLSEFARRLPQILETALYQEAERVMTESKRVVPVDTGTLRSTGHVKRPRRAGKTVEVEMGYGGPAAPYARIVHEWMDATVSWSTPGTGPKYLERPVLQNERKIRARLNREIERLARRVFV